MRKNATEVYHDLLTDILKNGVDKGDRTGTGTKSVFGRQIRMHMADGFPLITTKKVHTKSIIGELLWFLEGNTNAEYLREKYGCTIWDEWANEFGELGPIYGHQWVNWGGHYGEFNKHVEGLKHPIKGINQIAIAVEQLKNNPDGRRIMVSAWKVDEISKMALPPCHYGFQLWSRELTMEERWKLANLTPNMSEIDWCNNICDEYNVPKREVSLMWNQRSVDTFLGLPFNIASYALLLHMFAQQANMVAGELIGNLGDTHLYSNHMEYVNEQLTRGVDVHPSPTLVLNKAKDMFSYTPEDFKIEGYTSFPNWKNVPIAV